MTRTATRGRRSDARPSDARCYEPAKRDVMSRRRRCATCGERRAASGEWGGRPRAAGAALRLRGSSAPASGPRARGSDGNRCRHVISPQPTHSTVKIGCRVIPGVLCDGLVRATRHRVGTRVRRVCVRGQRRHGLCKYEAVLLFWVRHSPAASRPSPDFREAIPLFSPHTQQGAPCWRANQPSAIAGPTDKDVGGDLFDGPRHARPSEPLYLRPHLRQRHA